MQELIGYPPTKAPTVSVPTTIRRLAEVSKDSPGQFRSDIPLVLLAVEWGEVDLLNIALHNRDGSRRIVPGMAFPGHTYHYLNFSATKELIRAMMGEPMELIGLPGMLNDQTAAEAMFFNFKPPLEDSADRNAHPSWTELQKDAYIELLTEDVVNSMDSRGRTLWERFCTDIVAYCEFPIQPGRFDKPVESY